MNIKEFEVLQNQVFDVSLMYELYEDSEFDKKTYKIISSSDLFAEAKMNKEVFYYNITNKTSLRKYLSLGMDKETILNIVRRLMEAEQFFENNHLDKNYLLFDADLILVDKEDESLSFVVVPATNHGMLVKPLRAFIREILASSVYEESDNLDYVGRLLSYVNSKKEIDYRELENILGAIEATPEYCVKNEATAESVPEEVYEEIKETEEVEETEEAEEDEVVTGDVSEEAEEIEEVNEDASEEAADEEGTSVPEAVLQEDIPAPVEEDLIYVDVQEETPSPYIIDDIPVINIPYEVDEPEDIAVDISVDDLAVNLNDEIPDTAIDQNAQREAEERARKEAELRAQREAQERARKEAEEQARINQTKAYLVRTKSQEIILIDNDEFKIGKIPGMADYLLSDNPVVSRMHAIIHKVDGSYYVCDNYSTNHTYLNGEKLEAGKRYLLIGGAKVKFANEEFTFLIK